jgi:hypothetical protein
VIVDKNVEAPKVEFKHNFKFIKEQSTSAAKPNKFQNVKLK